MVFWIFCIIVFLCVGPGTCVSYMQVSCKNDCPLKHVHTSGRLQTTVSMFTEAEFGAAGADH
jgi:hypothetical protein